MPAVRYLGVPALVGYVLMFGCEVQDSGLVTPLPGPATGGSTGVQRETPPGPAPGQAPGIDPPAAPVAAAPDAAVSADASAVQPGDPPSMAALDARQRDAEPEAARTDAAPVSAANCAAVRNGPFTARLRDADVESDELTFDPQGRLLMIRNSDVVRLAAGSAPEIILRGVLGSQGGALRFLADGSLAVADYSGDEVVRFNLTTRTRLNSWNTDAPMKIAVGPTGRLYVSSNDGLIYGVSQNSGLENVLASGGGSVGGLAFSPDYQTLYAGMLDSNTIVSFAVRPQGGLVQRTVVARQVPYPYALTVDECGNLYASGGDDSVVRRISRTGRVDELVEINRQQLWGLAFGSGRQGWSHTALYVSSNSEGQSGLFEVELGVRGVQPPAAAEAPPSP
jgi:hypothetical protein